MPITDCLAPARNRQQQQQNGQVQNQTLNSTSISDNNPNGVVRNDGNNQQNDFANQLSTLNPYNSGKLV